MLFSGLGDLDAAARPTGPLTEHLERAASSGSPGLLNLHWTTPVLRGAADADEAWRRAWRLGELLEAFKAAGGRLVWTVHNVLPHDAAYVSAETEVCRLVADHADLVHVLCQETLPAVPPYYPPDPARVVTIPPSSHVGGDPQRIGRARARRRLGLGGQDRVLATLGLIRPYKGIDRLLDTFSRSPLDAPDLRLLVAGLQGDGPGMQALAARLATTPRVVSRTERV